MKRLLRGLPHMAGAPSPYGRSTFLIWQKHLPHMAGTFPAAARLLRAIEALRIRYSLATRTRAPRFPKRAPSARGRYLDASAPLCGDRQALWAAFKQAQPALSMACKEEKPPCGR